MSRYIDADKFLDDNFVAYMSAQAQIESKADRLVNKCAFLKVQMLVTQAPTADVVEVKHGKWKSYNIEWVRTDGTPIFLLCTECGNTVINNGSPSWNYCPHCGSRMDGAECEK